MKLTLSMLLLLAASPAMAQDDIFDSGLPKTKQAMLIVDVDFEKLFSDKVYGTLLGQIDFNEFGPFEKDDIDQISRLTTFVGKPDPRGDRFDFITRIKLKNKEAMPRMLRILFGREMRMRQENGWTICENRFREGWLGLIRFKNEQLEFGSQLYAYTPSKTLASRALASSFSALDKEASVRVAFDAQVLSSFFDGVLETEGAEEESVYEMIRYGMFVSNASTALYAAAALKELESASLSINLDADQIAKLSITPMSGKEARVSAKAQVLHDFIMFHFQLPVKTLKKKENPVADILEKVAAGIKIKTEQMPIEISMDRPKNLSQDFLAIVKKMKGSFADRENMNKVKQLALALHNFHDAMRQFPFQPSRFDKERFKDLSWRVKILPYMEYNHQYDRLDLTKGWDDENNAEVLAKCKNGFVLSNGALMSSINTERPATNFASILDGTSNTIMLIENRSAAMAPWAKPGDLDIDGAVAAVKALKEGDFLWVAMYDGSVWKLPCVKGTDVTDEELRTMFDPRDGRVSRGDEILQSGEATLFPGISRPRYRYKDEKFDKKADKWEGDIEEAAEALDDDTPAPAPRFRDKKAAAKDEIK